MPGRASYAARVFHFFFVLGPVYIHMRPSTEGDDTRETFGEEKGTHTHTAQQTHSENIKHFPSGMTHIS